MFKASRPGQAQQQPAPPGASYILQGEATIFVAWLTEESGSMPSFAYRKFKRYFASASAPGLYRSSNFFGTFLAE
jgi:hypothetical protein